MIDWVLAEHLAGFVAGEPAARPPGAALPELAERSERLVSAYTGLVPLAPLPAPEWLDRRQWARANLTSMRVVLDPVVGKLSRSIGPLRVPLSVMTGLALTAEIGVVVGLLAQRVLGQYELIVIEPKAPARLLFVAPNLAEAVVKLDVDEQEFLSWVALHEVTHALQFGAVPWLRQHLADLLSGLLASVDITIDLARMRRLPSRADLRSLVEAVRGGDLIGLVATADQRTIVAQMQATMAVLEGYAEHAMDAVGRDLLPNLPHLRAALDARRRSQRGVARLLARLLGLDMKLRQYEQGKRFCDSVVEAAGIATLNRVWSAPEAIPTAAELVDHASWLARTQHLGQSSG